MTEKRFTMCHEQNDLNGWTMSIIDWETNEPFDYAQYEVHSESITNTKDEMEDLCLLLNELNDENEQLKQQKPFLKIHDDYFIQYGDDNELFNLHKPSDIRSLCHLINRENGYDELECEYNEEGYGND